MSGGALAPPDLFLIPKKCPRARSALRYFLGAPNLPRKVSSARCARLRYFAGTPEELRMRECELAPVPNWLMGMKTNVQAAKYTPSDRA